MSARPQSEKLKFAAGAIIIAGAACIIMPGLLGYISGLWRLALWVGMALAAAFLVSVLWARLTVSRPGKGS